MGLQVNDLVVEQTLSASTLTATTLFVGTNSIGGTVSNFNSLSATTLSGGTIYSGGTDLYAIFATNASIVSTYVQPGSNITTGGTANLPTISVVASPSFNALQLSGAGQFATVTATSLSATTLSGGTILSGGTNLYNIFSTTDNNDITRVQPGSNIITGGTANLPTISVVASPSFNALTLSGTGQFAVVTATSLSAGTLSGGTILSGSTNLYSIFSQTDTVTRVQPGSNTSTGGTANAPTVSVVSSPSFNALTLSGAGQFAAVTATSLSAGTLSASTIISGSTNLYQIFAQTGSTLIHKSGTISGSTFAGNPKKSTVTFATAFANTNYAITILSDTNRTWTWESKAAGSFVINANSNTGFATGNVDWTATEYGEK